MKTHYKIPVIVLGMSVNGLGIVRSLSKADIKVYALDSDKKRAGMFTRCAKCLICPDIENHPNKFKNFLFDLKERIGDTGVLLPTSDAHNEFVNAHRIELEANFKFAMPPKALMEQLLDKKGQYILARKFNLPVPETYFPENIDEVRALAETIRFPVIIKGIKTGVWRQRFHEKKVIAVRNAEDLLQQYALLQNINHIEPMIQKIIPGNDSRHYKMCTYLDRNSKPLLIFTLQKILQYPCDFGIGSSVISRWEPEIAELGLSFLKKIGYWGVVSIEFKRDARDATWRMIEINPRFWAQNSLATACGQNFALTAYKDILGEKVEPKIEFKEGIKWIAFHEDRSSFFEYHRQGRAQWKEWLTTLLTGKRIWAIWMWDDPMPFLKTLKFGLLPFEKAYLRLQKLIKLKGAEVFKEKSGISLEVVNDFNVFENMRFEWNDLLTRSQINNPFLRHEWLAAWWKGYGQDKELLVMCFKKDGEIIGLAPLMRYKTRLCGLLMNAAGFISNHWVGLDFIFVDESYTPICLQEFANYLTQKKDLAILSYFNEDSETLRFLSRLKDTRLRIEVASKQTPYINITGSWEAYLKGRSYRFRAEYRKKQKMLEEKGKIEFLRFSDDFNGEQILGEIKAISQNSWQGKKGISILSSTSGDVFYNSLMKEYSKIGYLDVSLLRLNNRAISYLIGIKANGSFYVFDTAYDEEFKDTSPGMVIHNMLLETLFKDKIKIFDFGYVADYKRRWSDSFNRINDLIIFPSSLLGRLVGWIYRVKKQIKGIRTSHKETPLSSPRAILNSTEERKYVY